jgi:hypothetical protein
MKGGPLFERNIASASINHSALPNFLGSGVRGSLGLAPSQGLPLSSGAKANMQRSFTLSKMMMVPTQHASGVQQHQQPNEISIKTSPKNAQSALGKLVDPSSKPSI